MRKWSLYAGLVIATFTWSASCKDTAKKEAAVQTDLKKAEIAFYNVENIFDTENDPKTNDDDFTPTGKYQWTADRYRLKLEHTIDVFKMMSPDLPEIIGLCEIENRRVLDDMLSMPGFKGFDYGVVHKDSPDERGIDVAMLYDKKLVEVVSYEFLKVVLPNPEDPNTRDILYAEVKMGGEKIHVFINHWPSRSGGQEQSEPNRMKAAEVLRGKMDAVLKDDADARLICMGDFNDHPDNKSITEVVGARGDQSGKMYNLMAAKHANHEGSYWYKGEWGALDQFLISFNWMNAEHGWHISQDGARFVKDDTILFRDGQGNLRPNRTYAGDDYKGGYSDHLAAVVSLELR